MRVCVRACICMYVSAYMHEHMTYFLLDMFGHSIIRMGNIISVTIRPRLSPLCPACRPHILSVCVTQPASTSALTRLLSIDINLSRYYDTLSRGVRCWDTDGGVLPHALTTCVSAPNHENVLTYSITRTTL